MTIFTLLLFFTLAFSVTPEILPYPAPYPPPVAQSSGSIPTTPTATSVLAQTLSAETLIYDYSGSQKNKCCRTTHEIIVVDQSESMLHNSFVDTANHFLLNHWGFTDYLSVAFFGGAWQTTQPYYQIVDKNHELNPQSLTLIPYPSGYTLFDDAIRMAIKLLSQNFKDQTTIVFFSSGVQKLKDLNLINQFLQVKNKFLKSTGCRLKVLCFYNSMEPRDLTQIFRSHCEKLGATGFLTRNI